MQSHTLIIAITDPVSFYRILARIKKYRIAIIESYHLIALKKKSYLVSITYHIPPPAPQKKAPSRANRGSARR